jgi:hypothetical protein
MINERLEIENKQIILAHSFYANSYFMPSLRSGACLDFHLLRGYSVGKIDVEGSANDKAQSHDFAAAPLDGCL